MVWSQTFLLHSLVQPHHLYLRQLNDLLILQMGGFQAQNLKSVLLKHFLHLVIFINITTREIRTTILGIGDKCLHLLHRTLLTDVTVPILVFLTTLISSFYLDGMASESVSWYLQGLQMWDSLSQFLYLYKYSSFNLTSTWSSWSMSSPLPSWMFPHENTASAP